MKYMLIMRATDESFAAFEDVDFDEILETMGRFNDELITAGVLVAAEGLDDAAEGVVVDYSSQPPVVTDGPYGETKELFGGFWILDVASKEEAVEWAKRAPLTGPGHEDRDPPGRRASTSSRRTTSGSRRSGRGGRRPASCEPADRRRRDGARPSRPSGGSSPRGSSARWPATPATSRWPRTSPRRRWPRRWSPGRATACPRNPAGWLLTVGRRRAIDAFRRRVGPRRAVRRAGPRPGRGQATSGPTTRPDGRRAVGPRPDRRRRAGADVHRLPPGALARGPGRADAARGRRPDQRRDRPGVPGADRRPCRPGSPGRRRRSPRRRCRSRCRRPTSAASGSARCSACST